MSDLSSLTAPGSVLTSIAQRVTEFLSVKDLVDYLASSNVWKEGDNEGGNMGLKNARSTKYGVSPSRKSPPEEQRPGWCPDSPEEETLFGPGSGGADEGAGPNAGNKKRLDENLLWMLLTLGLQPWSALGLIHGGVSHVLSKLSLMGFLRWALGQVAAAWGLTVRVALLPFDISRGVVVYVIGTIEAMMSVATEVWCELRHLGLGELICVVTCLLKGESLPPSLFPPVEPDSEGSRGTYSRSLSTCSTRSSNGDGLSAASQ
ncbi:unnamed protein product, partial [Discosporangium mesarthrocarpum]